MQSLLYIEVNLLCLLILALVLVKVLRGNDVRSRQFWFSGVLLASILASALDMLWILVSTGSMSVSPVGSFGINATYYLMASLGSFCWFVYSERVQTSRLVASPARIVVCSAPLMVSFVLVLSSYWTGWALSIDAEGGYHRGSLYAVQFFIVYGYGLVTAAHALVGAFKKENFAVRSQYLSLTYFAVLPLAFITLQAFAPNVPLTCVGVTVALLWVYLDMQEQKISLDPLTQLNNRTQLAKHVAQRMRHRDAGQTLCLFIVDVDRFKGINDIYGHVEGDRALVRVADALRRCCAGGSAFIARYGGDEFIVVRDSARTCDATEMGARLNAELARLDEAAGAPYALHVSVGAAVYREGIETLQDFIREADRELYEAKAARAA